MTQNGKGDSPRPFSNYQCYSDNWDNIDFSSKQKKIPKGFRPRKNKSLKGLTNKDYHALLRSGMFWEWYPDATGKYEKDCL